MIDTTTNTVAGTPIPVGINPKGVAIAPDGKHVYVVNFSSASVSVIDTTTNMAAAATIPVGPQPFGVAVTPDGKHAYVANFGDNTVSVIDTTTNMAAAATIPVGPQPFGVAVTPDGKHVYVTNIGSNDVSVIDTTTNMAAAVTIPVGRAPSGITVTPDGKHAYVANQGSNDVSVIDTATNTVVAGPPTTTPLTVGNAPIGVGIMPAPAGVPFLAFSAQLQIHFGSKPNHDAFALESSFTLSSTAPAINPVTQAVTLQVGTFTTTIPAGFFKAQRGGAFTFVGVINGVNLQALILPTGTLRYAFLAAAQRASLTGTTNPVQVTLTIGDDRGLTSVTARIR